MKKWTFSLLTVLILILNACTPKAYTDSIEAGKSALNKGNYTEAIDKFENAIEEKDTSEAKNYLHIAESMKEAVALYHKGDFDSAIYTLNKVLKEKEAKKSVNKQAASLLKEIKKAKLASDTMKEQMVKGRTLLEQNQYDEALAVFKEVSESKQFTDIPSIEKLTNDAAELVIETTSKKKKADEEKQEAAKQEEEKAKQKQEEENKVLTHEQAEDLVRKHLNISADQNIKVIYDHDAKNGDYIIHVYEVVVDNPQTGEGHTATWGWYGVNKETKIIYDAMQ